MDPRPRPCSCKFGGCRKRQTMAAKHEGRGESQRWAAAVSRWSADRFRVASRTTEHTVETHSVRVEKDKNCERVLGCDVVCSDLPDAVAYALVAGAFCRVCRNTECQSLCMHIARCAQRGDALAGGQLGKSCRLASVGDRWVESPAAMGATLGHAALALGWFGLESRG